jgi:hypothetical protein
MSDPDGVELWLTDAFAQVEAPPGVGAGVQTVKSHGVV